MAAAIALILSTDLLVLQQHWLDIPKLGTANSEPLGT